MGGVVSIGVLVGLSLSTLAYAGEAPPTNKARAHFRKGMAQYVLNHYDEAIVEFEAGFAADPIPAFLFNLAQSHARAGRKEKAIEFYRKYLDMGAPAQDVVVVQEAIERLERELRPPPPSPEAPPKIVTASVTPAPAPRAKAPTVETPAPAAVRPAPVVVAPAPVVVTPTRNLHAGRAKKYAGIATAAVGAAALVAGMGLSISARTYSDELTRLDQTHGVFDQNIANDGKTFDAAGASMLAIGGAALVAGVVVAVLGFRESKRAKLAATTGSSGLSVSF
jgi:tetratricopeptide (TPR) repeat protein